MLIDRFTTWRDAPKTLLLLHSISTMSYTSFLLSCITNKHVHVAAACVTGIFPTEMSLHFLLAHRPADATVTAISKMITTDQVQEAGSPGRFLSVLTGAKLNVSTSR
jgi:hypothetical protein